MNQIYEVLARLRAFSPSQIDGRLGRALEADRELFGLERRLIAMRERPSPMDSAPPPQLNIEELRKRWSRFAPELSVFTRREVRALCWDVIVGADLRFVTAIRSQANLASNARLLRGLWFVHERQWRITSSALIEGMIESRARMPGLVPRWLRTLAAEPALLSPAAPAALVKQASSDWRRARDLLNSLAITPDGSLGSSAIDKMVRAWVEDVCKSSSSESAVARFDAGHDGLLVAPMLPVALFHHCVERLVGAVNQLGKPYRERVAVWIVSDARLGHPARRLTRGNWAGITERTRQLAVQLFAARDLGAFFQVLIGTGQDEQLRRPFWERYVESPQLVNFAIASDYFDRKKLVAALGRDRAQVATLVDAPSDHSAFLMHFRGKYDIVIAEMSKANNAMYMYLASNFESGVGDLQDAKFTFAGLKDQSLMQQRLTHRGDWHWRFESTLRAYGVVPG